MKKPLAILLIVASILGVSARLSAEFNGRVGELVKSAESYSKQGNHSMAILMYDSAMKLQPGNIDLNFRRAAILGRAGYYARAISDLNVVISNDEMNSSRRYPTARVMRAKCYAISGYYYEAINDYKEQLKNARKRYKLLLYLSETYAVMNRMDLALSTINQAIAEYPSDKDLNNLRIKILKGEKIELHKPY